jgi:hypothetical protein
MAESANVANEGEHRSRTLRATVDTEETLDFA